MFNNNKKNAEVVKDNEYFERFIKELITNIINLPLEQFWNNDRSEVIIEVNNVTILVSSSKNRVFIKGKGKFDNILISDTLIKEVFTMLNKKDENLFNSKLEDILEVRTSNLNDLKFLLSNDHVIKGDEEVN